MKPRDTVCVDTTHEAAAAAMVAWEWPSSEHSYPALFSSFLLNSIVALPRSTLVFNSQFSNTGRASKKSYKLNIVVVTALSTLETILQPT